MQPIFQFKVSMVQPDLNSRGGNCILLPHMATQVRRMSKMSQEFLQ